MLVSRADGSSGSRIRGSSSDHRTRDHSDDTSLRLEGVQRVEHGDDLSSDTGADDDPGSIIPDYA